MTALGRYAIGKIIGSAFRAGLLAFAAEAGYRLARKHIGLPTNPGNRTQRSKKRTN